MKEVTQSSANTGCANISNIPSMEVEEKEKREISFIKIFEKALEHINGAVFVLLKERAKKEPDPGKSRLIPSFLNICNGFEEKIEDFESRCSTLPVGECQDEREKIKCALESFQDNKRALEVEKKLWLKEELFNKHSDILEHLKKIRKDNSKAIEDLQNLLAANSHEGQLCVPEVAFYLTEINQVLKNTAKYFGDLQGYLRPFAIALADNICWEDFEEDNVSSFKSTLKEVFHFNCEVQEYCIDLLTDINTDCGPYFVWLKNVRNSIKDTGLDFSQLSFEEHYKLCLNNTIIKGDILIDTPSELNNILTNIGEYLFNLQYIYTELAQLNRIIINMENLEFVESIKPLKLFG